MAKAKKPILDEFGSFISLLKNLAVSLWPLRLCVKCLNIYNRTTGILTYWSTDISSFIGPFPPEGASLIWLKMTEKWRTIQKLLMYRVLDICMQYWYNNVNVKVLEDTFRKLVWLCLEVNVVYIGHRNINEDHIFKDFLHLVKSGWKKDSRCF